MAAADEGHENRLYGRARERRRRRGGPMTVEYVREVLARLVTDRERIGDYALVERSAVLPNGRVDARRGARSAIVGPEAALAA